jgi:hypothetical protein
MKRLYQVVALSMIAGSFSSFAQQPTPSLPARSLSARGQLMALNAPKPEQITANSSLADVTISGKVIDEKGSGLPGVSVIVKGSTQGTNTDGTGF